MNNTIDNDIIQRAAGVLNTRQHKDIHTVIIELNGQHGGADVHVQRADDAKNFSFVVGAAALPDGTSTKVKLVPLTDEELIAEVGKKVREKYPTAATYSVESGDQTPGRGYTLSDVTLADGTDLTFGEDSAEFEEFADLLDETLADIAWGSFGDANRDSLFSVDVATGRIVR